MVKSGLFLKEEIMKVPIHNLLASQILPENVKNYARDCDIMILQYINNERNELNHTFVRNLNKNAKCIIIPHYTSTIYNYTSLPITRHFEEFSTPNNCINAEKVEICINKMIEKDKLSDVKMSIFFKENYDKYLLFSDEYHPTNLFCYEMVKQIFEILNIPTNNFVCIPHNKNFPVAQTNQDINIFLNY